mgnify:CR=1 FL=1
MKSFVSNFASKCFCYYSIFLFMLFAHPLAGWTADSGSKKTVQKVGGLLFDVDDGVKIEEGSGGSVYMHSNREFMQSKFDSIETRFSELESRVQRLEKQLKEAKPGESTLTAENPQSPEGRKVLVG